MLLSSWGLQIVWECFHVWNALDWDPVGWNFIFFFQLDCWMYSSHVCEGFFFLSCLTWELHSSNFGFNLYNDTVVKMYPNRWATWNHSACDGLVTPDLSRLLGSGLLLLICFQKSRSEFRPNSKVFGVCLRWPWHIELLLCHGLHYWS